MYPEVERSDANSDFKCPNCERGVDIYTEYCGDETYNIDCPWCNCRINVKQEVIKTYTCVMINQKPT
jgi:hypothetical protein